MYRFLTTACLGFLLTGAARAASTEETVERYAFYQDGPANGYRVAAWNMVHTERPGGARSEGAHLLFNMDWRAAPWAGMAFKDGAELVLTAPWLENGFVRFLLNAGATRYGHPAGAMDLQVMLATPGGEYQRVRARHVDRGRGLDEDPESWQEVLVPLSYWTDLEPDSTVSGLSVQTVKQAERTFGIAEVGLVRYAEPPAWYVRERTRTVAQPEVTWPAFEDLPEALRADRRTVCIRHERFTGPDGKRVFVLNPYTREDARLDLWGGNRAERRPPDHGLYDAETQGWIYSDLLTLESLCRLGFNSLAVTMPARPWWDEVGYRARDAADPALLPALRERVQVPFLVDCVCWPWSLGKAALPAAAPAEALTQGRHHWTPYRIIGTGRQQWLDLWALYARRYAAAGADVLVFELFNEPAYLPTSRDHRRAFEAWLKARYPDLETLNRTWNTSFDAWSRAASYTTHNGSPVVEGQHLDYDECLAEQFADLVRAGAAVVHEHLAEALVGVQTMSGFVAAPHEAIWKHRFVDHEGVVITPTGGGRWTPGSGSRTPASSALGAPMAGAPLENDLLLTLAGAKMVIDNETYLRGQTRTDTFNRLWQHVVCGLDGLTVFNWGKRGWTWPKGREALETEADKYPYANLIPLARRTDALRGIHDFAASIQPIADEILPKPWGPEPKIAFVYSWDDARRRLLEPGRHDKRGAYFAALKYAHWNMAVVPADAIAAPGGLDGFAVAVLAGVTHVERALPEALRTFVEGGGILLVGEEPFDRDLYGHPLETSALIGCMVTGSREQAAGKLEILSERQPDLLPGEIVSPRPGRALALSEGVHPLVQNHRHQPVLTRRRMGRGLVYYQGAGVVGYRLAKLLGTALLDAAKQQGKENVPDTWRAARIADEATGQLATNILLSRRSYPDRGLHALLMFNLDSYPKTISVRLAPGKGRWRVDQPVGPSPMQTQTLTDRALAARGISLPIEANAPSVVLLRRE